MKTISTALGKFIIVAAAAVLIFAFITSALMPYVRDYFSVMFPKEQNYIISEGNPAALTLSCSSDVIKFPVGSGVNIFANITAKTSDNENLISQLTEDYAKDVNERTQVFVYKINSDGSAVLSEQIDTSVKGEWTVLYIIKNNSEIASLKVTYMII